MSRELWTRDDYEGSWHNLPNMQDDCKLYPNSMKDFTTQKLLLHQKFTRLKVGSESNSIPYKNNASKHSKNESFKYVGSNQHIHYS